MAEESLLRRVLLSKYATIAAFVLAAVFFILEVLYGGDTFTLGTIFAIQYAMTQFILRELSDVMYNLRELGGELGTVRHSLEVGFDDVVGAIERAR